MEGDTKPRFALPDQFAWLADAPLFIDEDQVERFYDATIQPEYETGVTKFQLTDEKVKEIGGKLGISAEASPGVLAGWLSALFNVKVSGEAKVEATGKRNERESVELELRPIKTPQRQLVQLTIHYLMRHPGRLILSDNRPTTWPNPETILAVPRAIAFVDLSSATSIVPTAAEFEDASIVPLFLEFDKDKEEKQPRYPEKGTVEELQKLRKEYWKWFHNNVTATQAMIVIEEAASKHGKLRWIDYRVLLSDEGDTVHLHVRPCSRYDTGVLAYNVVKRGNKHGLRIVGTIKSEPDVNVLAIYEK